MKLRQLLFIALAISLFSCSKKTQTIDPIQYVNPLIGTGGHGHTYPGATSPFGMVQLSPDTRLEGWDGCSGYHYTDSVIYGFSHTHLSGTGISDYGDILIMPITGTAVYKNTEYASSFSHQNEIAEAGYYHVLLDEHQIEVNLSTSARTGMHQYTFAQTQNNKIILDLNHRDIVLDAYIHQVNDSAIEGYRVSKAWAQQQYVYFYMQFSQKIDLLEIASQDSIFTNNVLQSTDIVASIHFNEIPNKKLLVKVGLSSVDMAGAKNNLLNENPNWEFEEFKLQNQNRWRDELNKVQIIDNDESKKTIFYTALYHNLIVPNLFSDIDGRYRGMDKAIHHSETDQYTVFSLWDTYRATHPLYTLIESKRVADFIHTFKNQYDDGGVLPIWELSANYTNCMIGYHAIPVIADAYLKGLTSIPVDTLLQMMLTSANQNRDGLEAFKKNGYISISDDAESVSRTLEYAYDDWCIAQIAQKAGKDSIYKVFIERAQSYKNILDQSIGYMRPKLNEIWKKPFNPAEVDFNYTEANSWQYSFYVPQDIYTFIELLGGDAQFEKQLDDLFNASSENVGREQSDITGLIGQYAHGNEPSHHMAYLYNYVNKAEKSQNYVQRIMNELYTDQPDGLCGNEDCGQMSAWYVFSAMGFYPVNPANGEYVFGKPLFDKMTIQLENGKTFTIEKTGESADNSVVKQILLNSKPYNKAFINHSDIIEGGTLTFEMSKSENVTSIQKELPSSIINDFIIIPVPAIRDGERVFKTSTTITLEAMKGCVIIYTINGGQEMLYELPITFTESVSLNIKATKDGKSSKTMSTQLYKIPEGRTLTISSPWREQYSAGGNDALIDGLIGTPNFRTGTWQGYMFNDFEAVLDLGKPQPVSTVAMNFIQDAGSWIWMPEYVEYWGSTDSIHYFSLGKIMNDIPKMDYKVQIKTYKMQVYPKMVRYIKIFAKNHNICPKGHLGEGGQGYIFVDEIIVGE